MIDDVRRTVLNIVNKDNRGYITPDEFNTFARMAQNEIFEQYMYSYTNEIVKQNNRANGEGYSNIPQKISEMLDRFSVYAPLTYDAIPGKFNTPTDYYYIEKLVYNNSVEIERVEHSKIFNLLASNLTAPTVNYPVYILSTGTSSIFNQQLLSEDIKVYPLSITGSVLMRYIRYPYIPNWGFIFTPNGEALYNAASSVDFELPQSDFVNLVVKILQYAGISIREQEVSAAAKSEEIQDAQQKQ
jgi:hypothetical protein